MVPRTSARGDEPAAEAAPWAKPGRGQHIEPRCVTRHTSCSRSQPHPAPAITEVADPGPHIQPRCVTEVASGDRYARSSRRARLRCHRGARSHARSLCLGARRGTRTPEMRGSSAFTVPRRMNCHVASRKGPSLTQIAPGDRCGRCSFRQPSRSSRRRRSSRWGRAPARHPDATNRRQVGPCSPLAHVLPHRQCRHRVARIAQPCRDPPAVGRIGRPEHRPMSGDPRAVPSDRQRRRPRPTPKRDRQPRPTATPLASRRFRSTVPTRSFTSTMSVLSSMTRSARRPGCQAKISITPRSA